MPKNKKIEDYKLKIRVWTVKPTVGNMFQVSNGYNVFVVSLTSKACFYREPDLIGIPYVHGIASIHFMKDNPLDYVDDYYRKT